MASGAVHVGRCGGTRFVCVAWLARACQVGDIDRELEAAEEERRKAEAARDEAAARLGRWAACGAMRHGPGGVL